MAIIALGSIDKRFFLILALIILKIAFVVSTYEEKTYELYDTNIIYMEDDVGSLIAGIILIFIFKPKKKEKSVKIKNFKYFIILFILKMIQAFYYYLYFYIFEDPCYSYNFIQITFNGLELIFVTIGTFALLKYKYYIHHIICLIIFFFLSCGADFILGYYRFLKFDYLYVYFIFVINDALIYCYLKYMMDKLFYHYSELLIFFGIFGFLSKGLCLLGIIIYEEKNNIDGQLYMLKFYFETNNIYTIIFFQFFYFIVIGSLSNIFLILMLFYLKPNHAVIVDELYFYTITFIYYKNPKNKELSIIFVFQIIILLFYYEILEFNFLGLNKNTVKNIKQRERNENEEKQSINSEIELADQYYMEAEEILHSKGSDGSDGYDDQLIDDKHAIRDELFINQNIPNTNDEIVNEFEIKL